MLRPAYIRNILVLLGLVLVVYCLSYLGGILRPFLFSGLLAILLNPLNNWLQRRMPRMLAISLTVLFAIILVAGLLSFISIQASQFADAVPMLKQKLNQYVASLQAYTQSHFHLSSQKQLEYINKGLDQGLSSGGNIALTALGAVGGIAIVLTLVPVYVFLLLLYKPLLVEFIHQIFADENVEKVTEILKEVKQVVQSYVSGLLIEAAIVAAMNVGALLILGVPYAILIGVIGAILNLVPYIGGIIAIALPMLMALITQENGLQAAGLVVVAYVIIQFIDNNLIQPKVVASKVKINALLSIIAVLSFGELWGVGGMFLAIPIVAIFKIIFDRVEDLQPWGMILGDDIPGDQPQEASLNDKPKTVVG